ncbi:MAG TPA: hypothetical protein V6C81_22840 [Planktothrix sp.]|jgi:hypothetical protein
MFLVIWRGWGLLVPVIAILCALAASAVCGQAPESTGTFATFLMAAVALGAVGMFLRSKQLARHLYWIPMEGWAVVSAVVALLQIPKMIGAC